MARAYRSRLREEQAAATRERILDAAWALLRHVRPVDLAFAAIAEDAGVSTRTVYRHFPTPDDLFRALSDRLMSRVTAGGGLPRNVHEGMDLIRAQLEQLEADPALFRLFFAVPTRSRFPARPAYEAAFAPLVPDVPESDRDALYAVIDLFASPYAWDVFHHNWGVPPDRAHRAIGVALRALFDHLRAHPDALDPAGPDPVADLETR